jgi:hypothetical protein
MPKKWDPDGVVVSKSIAASASQPDRSQIMFNQLAKILDRFRPVVTYDISLADYECLLPELAQIISANYEPGSFDSIEEQFHRTGDDTLEWSLIGEFGQLVVYLEKYEGYYSSSFKAPEQQFQMGKNLLWEAYIKQGGSPTARKKP